METLSNSVVLGYHGCRKEIAEKILVGEGRLQPSENEYDWLGSGIYLWEADPVRGFEWAKERHGADAVVIGAAIHLGRSLNLMSRHAYEAIAHAYEKLEKKVKTAGNPLPTNGATGRTRKLDCAVIDFLHQIRATNAPEPLRPYDTVRGLFTEGEAAFPGSLFLQKTHIQICVRETRVIKGYFRVFPEHLRPAPHPVNTPG